MARGRIPDSDSLFRQSVYPIAFKGKAFATEKFIKLQKQPNGSLLASLTWQRYVPTTEFVHGYGCRLAFRINDRKRKSGKLKAKNRSVYCGAYEVRGKALRALAGASGLSEVLSVDIVHAAEAGEIAHADLRVYLRPESEPNLELIKTALVDRLWNMSCGPLRHICNCDADLAEHPSSDLMTPPGGPYQDNRSYLLRLWHVLRFRIRSWVWKTFSH